MPLLFLGDKGKRYSSTKYSPSNMHRQLRALDQGKKQAHLFLIHDAYKIIITLLAENRSSLAKL